MKLKGASGRPMQVQSDKQFTKKQTRKHTTTKNFILRSTWVSQGLQMSLSSPRRTCWLSELEELSALGEHFFYSCL